MTLHKVTKQTKVYTEYNYYVYGTFPLAYNKFFERVTY